MRTARTLLAGLALVGLTAVVGCSKTANDAKPPEKEAGVKDTATPGHEHGPHGGHLADLGTDHKYRAEIAVYNEPRRVAVFFLNHDDHEPADLKPEAVELHLEPHSEGESGGHALTKQTINAGGTDWEAWVLDGDKVPASVKSVEDVHGHIHVTVAGKELMAEFEEDHEEHDHADGEKGHDH